MGPPTLSFPVPTAHASTHILGREEKPLLCRLRIRDGLLGGKGLKPESTAVSLQLRLSVAWNQGPAAEAMWVPSDHEQ